MDLVPHPGFRMREHFSTRSTDEAVAVVEQLYGPHTLALNAGRKLEMRLRGFDVGRLNVSCIEYGCAATAYTELPTEHWVFAFAARGEASAGKYKGTTGAAAVHRPDDVFDIPMSADLRLVNLKVAHTDLVDAARTLFGDAGAQPLAFDTMVSPGSRPAVHLAGLVQRLNALPQPATPHARLLERRWQEAALMELLLVWPHALSLSMHAADAPRSAVDRAVDLIEADPSAELSLAEVAAAAGIGIRALTRAFQKRLGVSPMRYLQQCRLERARADLLDRRGTVTEVAYSWGFGNLGDFSARYRARFGELPNETLRRPH